MSRAEDVSATAPDGPGRPRLVVIGPPGVGKSTVAREVARRLDLALHDSDTIVEERAGRSIGDIFLEDGEAAFRELEQDAVRAALTTTGSVVALGGGAPMTAAVAEALQGHDVLFLDVGIADAAKRIGLNRSRPLLAVNPRATWVATMEERRPTYERLARWQVDTAGRGVDEVVAEVLAVLGEDGTQPHGEPGGSRPDVPDADRPDAPGDQDGSR
ncbi:shikimate kinase [Janibacter alkaliphilus]|uniref:Shikimate kinase n=1 Tax=Janibacter alkaliphilus TaxID=1069963 RepID=A0A852X5K9_9MICO|nr:shikimate kinase [Janibacter alkaliphilus]